MMSGLRTGIVLGGFLLAAGCGDASTGITPHLEVDLAFDLSTETGRLVAVGQGLRSAIRCESADFETVTGQAIDASIPIPVRTSARTVYVTCRATGSNGQALSEGASAQVPGNLPPLVDLFLDSASYTIGSRARLHAEATNPPESGPLDEIASCTFRDATVEEPPFEWEFVLEEENPTLVVVCRDARGGVGSGQIVAETYRLHLDIQEGDQQQGMVGDPLPTKLAVHVTIDGSDPASGAPVRWAILDATHGLVSDSLVWTDEHGLAQITWTLGTVAAEQYATAWTNADSVTFRADALAGPVASLTIESTFTDPMVHEPFTVSVTAADVFGNPVSGDKVDLHISDPDVLTLSSSGAYHGLREGTVTLTATSETVEATVSLVIGPFQWAKAVASFRRTCLLSRRGAVYCMGALPDSWDVPISDRPVPVPTPEPIVDITAGANSFCVVGESGRVYCWGSNMSGLLGIGHGQSADLPTPLDTHLRFDSYVGAEVEHSCGRRGTEIYCAGAVPDGSEGDSPLFVTSSPIHVSLPVAARTVGVGRLATCITDPDGMAWCWGYNTLGQLGIGEPVSRTVPTPVAADWPWQMYTVGTLVSCGIRKDTRQVYCAGWNTGYRLGTDAASDVCLALDFLTGWTEFPCSLTPIPVEGAPPARVLSRGESFGCIISDVDGTVWCWGDDTNGYSLPLAQGYRENPNPVPYARPILGGSCRRLPGHQLRAWMPRDPHG